MIIVTATITAKPGKRNEIISKSNDLIKSTRLEPGCINYNLYASTENEDALVMVEQWENKEVLDTHMQTDHFKAFGVAIGDILAEDLGIDIYSAEKV
ncbi:putative quinol monooxygenase [Methanobacterium sp.]|uniref:putative quinol monooxygenase n=1 Tax=Methanobacterium sp. TaxID=2164 RepID=UPI0025E2756A|nr:putative quinol monooxygenase [Methanobacterium sp.]MBI5458388.1 antibiotic biosynthesis monooxygenase [Methanobacterium sp.]